jgi:hypothetical protein
VLAPGDEGCKTRRRVQSEHLLDDLFPLFPLPPLQGLCVNPVRISLLFWMKVSNILYGPLITPGPRLEMSHAQPTSSTFRTLCHLHPLPLLPPSPKGYEPQVRSCLSKHSPRNRIPISSIKLVGVKFKTLRAKSGKTPCTI